MDQVETLLESKRLENLDGKPSDKILSDASEVVLFDELVEIETEEFEGDDEVLSEYQVVEHPDDVVLVLLVVVVQVLQDLQLHACLVLEFLLVPDDFNGHHFVGLVVKALQSLSETARTE